MTIFKSVGLAVVDIIVANYLYEKAVDNIHSVAQEFERMDNELHNTFR
ncbi:TPA: TIGR04197 family type VII secretion effector [Bacillus cereus]|nr:MULTISPECIES: TIGR04197 family type VII secretion effector [Bacillus cereus group]MBJ8094413.1 TIGR04197 family type VII secretion effector [Bacillus cereus]HDR3889351.1 TIGR04197 family type VII secretion effector [Bacillus cereus]